MTSESTKKIEDRREVMRHSTSHVMAEAVHALFPEVKFGIGPTIQKGFYYDYDFDLTHSLAPRISSPLRRRCGKSSPQRSLVQIQYGSPYCF